MKDKPKIVYKVVRDEFGRLCGESPAYSSCVVGGFYSLLYVIGERTIAPNKHWIYAFKTLKDARDFTKMSSLVKVIKCEARVVDDEPMRCIVLESVYEPYEEFWKQVHSPDMHSSFLKFVSGEVPEGTVWCEWVKPIKEVA